MSWWIRHITLCFLQTPITWIIHKKGSRRGQRPMQKRPKAASPKAILITFLAFTLSRFSRGAIAAHLSPLALGLIRLQ
jgi:hypothetical protein